MKKVLVLLTHPNIDKSVFNKALSEEIDSLDHVTLVELHKEYSDYKIDIKVEQKRLLEADHYVFQFPLFWYSTPALLKEWLDVVLEYGFAFGKNSKLKGKTISVVTTAGTEIEDYVREGENTLETKHLYMFERTAEYCHMSYAKALCFYGTNSDVQEEKLQKMKNEYRNYLINIAEPKS